MPLTIAMDSSPGPGVSEASPPEVSRNSTSPVPVTGAAVSFDAGVNGCRLILGPVQQPWTGAATLVATGSAVELIVNKGGVPTISRLNLPPLRHPSPGRVVSELPPTRVSSPPCAVGADQIFCMDPEGIILRTSRSGEPAVAVAKGRPGTRLAAATIAGSRAILAYLGDRKTTGGIVSEAYAFVDGAPPVRISEEGSGATAVSLAPRGPGVLALLIDGRAAMTPVHARRLELNEGRLDIGADAVVFVGGGAERHSSGVLAVGGAGTAFALVPISGEAGFGVAAVHLSDPPALEEKVVWSTYPNGLDPAPIAATTGSTPVRVARLRPIDARPDSLRGVELGKLDGDGEFAPYGLISTVGRVSALEVAADAAGALWIYYVDAAGSWLERRLCP